jgi:hypothetical protein
MSRRAAARLVKLFRRNGPRSILPCACNPYNLMRIESNIAATVIGIAVIVAVVVVMVVTGWADDKAPPGSGGRGGPVSVTSTSPR